MRQDLLGEKDVEEIIRLRRDDDMTLKEISEQTGWSAKLCSGVLVRSGLIQGVEKKKRDPMSERKWFHVQLCRDHGMTSDDVADILDVLLPEVNRAYASSTYDGYVRKKTP